MDETCIADAVALHRVVRGVQGSGERMQIVLQAIRLPGGVLRTELGGEARMGLDHRDDRGMVFVRVIMGSREEGDVVHSMAARSSGDCGEVLLGHSTCRVWGGRTVLLLYIHLRILT